MYRVACSCCDDVRWEHSSCPQLSEFHWQCHCVSFHCNISEPELWLRPACFLYAGTNSYMLFTLDKLICKIVKQFQALLVDDLAQVSAMHLANCNCAKTTPH